MTGALLSMREVGRLSQVAPQQRRRLGLAILVVAFGHGLILLGLASPPPTPVARPAPAVLQVLDFGGSGLAPAAEQLPTPTQQPPPPVVTSSARASRGPGSGAPVRVAEVPKVPQALPPQAPQVQLPQVQLPQVQLPQVQLPQVQLPQVPLAEQASQTLHSPQSLNAPNAPLGPATLRVPLISEPVAATPGQGAAASESEASALAAPPVVPVYATLMPPPAVLHFRMRRGLVQGNAELTWRLDAGRYEARLDARASGIPFLTQVSQGGIDAAGLAPQRFTDKRLRRSAVAANFQRDAGSGGGKISFSGSAAELDLHAGTQDRLSWLVQLSAIANAEPKLFAAQGEVALHVVGARGEADVWQFLSFGEENMAAQPAGRRVFRLQRLPQSVYDTAVDVWLDATPPHWPVRAHWRNGPQDPGLELWRIDIAEPR